MGARPPVGNLVTQALGRGSILGLVFLPGLNCIQLNCSQSSSVRFTSLLYALKCWIGLAQRQMWWTYYNSGRWNECRIVCHHPHLLPRPPLTWNWNALHVVLPFGSFIHPMDKATTMQTNRHNSRWTNVLLPLWWRWYLVIGGDICIGVVCGFVFGCGLHHMRSWAWRMSMDGQFKRPLAGLIARTHWLK